jgi:hypothetical protein
MKLVVPLRIPMIVRSRGERLHDGLHERDAAAHAGFEKEVDTPAGGHREQLIPARRHKLFVGGHDGLAARQGIGDIRTCRLDPADDLHDHINCRVLNHRAGVANDQPRRHRHRADPVRVGHRDAAQQHRHAGTPGDLPGALQQQLGHGPPDRAQTQQPDLTRPARAGLHHDAQG